MDGATPANARIAVEKGRTAAESRRSTLAWQERIKARPEHAQHAGDHADPGRRCRSWSKAPASARVGISGVQSHEDEQIAAAGIKAVIWLKVLIAGAGIGGLTAALAALRRGFDVEVYEQAPELKEVGAGLQLSANGTRVFYELGVGERAEGALLRGRRQGNPPVEHRRDLEAVRSRQGLGRALRLSVLHRLPARSARGAGVGHRPRAHPSRREMHRLHADAKRRSTAV